VNGRHVVITGATRGIGRETGLALARKGASVTLVVRDGARGEEVAKELRTAGAPSADVEVADFTSLRAVKEAGERILRAHPAIDVLVNNAGAINTAREMTKDGYETTFAANHLAPFLLTKVLRPALERADKARVVNVASDAHYRGTLPFDDLMGERKFDGWAAYCASKLANVLFTAELAKRLEGTHVTANALHPGVVASGFAQNNKGGVISLFFRVASPFLLTEAKGARTSIFLASSPEVEGVTGKYFAKCKAKAPSREARDPAVAKRLWDVSEELVAKALG
jgi:retinol dehydrogenase 12